MNLVAILCWLSTFIMQGAPSREHVRVFGQQLWRYVVHDFNMNLDASISWCRVLGGELPFIHNQEDMDFLTDEVISSEYTGWWIGLKRNSGSCKHYLDGSLLDYNFTYHDGKTCSSCSSDNCALIALSTQPKKVSFTNSKDNRKPVCIIPSINVKSALKNQTLTLSSRIQTEVEKLRGSVTNDILTLKNDIEKEVTSLSRNMEEKITQNDQSSKDRMEEFNTAISNTLDKQNADSEKRFNNFTSSIRMEVNRLNANLTALLSRSKKDKIFLILFIVCLILIAIILCIRLPRKAVKVVPIFSRDIMPRVHSARVPSLESPVSSIRLPQHA